MKSRPLSPHLSIYKPQISSVLSILHRMTGCALAFGLLIFVAWLVFLAGGEKPYTMFTDLCHTLVAQIFLVGFTFSFFYHFWNGIRHLIWDAGYALSIKGMNITGWFVVFISIFATVMTWLKIWGVMA